MNDVPLAEDLRAGGDLARPHDIDSCDAERFLLGAVLQSNRVFDKVAVLLRPEHFAYLPHRVIYEAIAALINRGLIADQVTLKTYLQGEGALEKVGGWQYIIELSHSIVSIINAADYAETIRELWVKRKLAALNLDLSDALVRPDPAIDYRAQLRQKVAEMEQVLMPEEGDGIGLRHVSEYGRAYLDRVETAAKFSYGQVLGVPTGLADLDDALGGIPRGCLTFIGGRPSMGKTLTAMKIAKHASGERVMGEPERTYGVAVFTLEVEGEKLMASWAAADTKISARDQFRAGLRQEDLETCLSWEQDFRKGLDGRPRTLWIDDTAGITIEQIGASIRALHRREKLDLVVIDYLQLINVGDGAHAAERSARLGQATRYLKVLARLLNVAILVLSQVNRECEERDDKRPQLRDLAESGSIEKDADIVIFVFREHYYLKREVLVQTRREKMEDFLDREHQRQLAIQASANKIELIISKNKFGPIATVTAYTDLATGRVENLDTHQGTFEAL